MNSNKYFFALDSIIKIGIIIILIVAATTNQQYGFYTFLRWSAMVSSVYFAYKYYTNKQIGLLILFAAIAILFNPFIKIWFQKDTWHLVDIIIAVIIILTLVYDWVLFIKNKELK